MAGTNTTNGRISKLTNSNVICPVHDMFHISAVENTGVQFSSFSKPHPGSSGACSSVFNCHQNSFRLLHDSNLMVNIKTETLFDNMENGASVRYVCQLCG